MPVASKRVPRGAKGAAKAGRPRARSKPSAGPSRPAAGDSGERVSSADQIVAEIVRGLYEGTYVAGQKLTEADLAKKFGVGRGSVREAISRLAAEGLVTVSLHRGASIRALTRDDVRDVLEVIEALSGLSARLAAERSSAEDHRNLRELLASLTSVASTGEVFEYGRMRNRFYRQLAQIGGNRELARLVPMVQAHLIRVQFRAAYGVKTERYWLADYKQIIEAVIANDEAKAERLMKQHIRRTARAIDMLPDQAFAS